MGLRTLLLTHTIETVGAMSCNPAIGGIGKGHLVRRSTPLGGIMARRRPGRHSVPHPQQPQRPAVRATRCQADRALYRATVRTLIETSRTCMYSSRPPPT